MNKIKKTICIILSLCMIACYSFPISASANEYSESIDLITRNCKTGELTYSTFTSNLTTNQNTETSNFSSSFYTESTQAWFPQANAENINIENSVTPCTIFGEDNRIKVTDTTQFPHSAICYLEVQFEEGETHYGTAFMISKNIALTAGHMLYDHELG